MNKNNPYKKEAVQKWRVDLEFIQNFERVEAHVLAKSIKTPIKKYKI